jgi:hypothetical protein
MKLNLDTLKTAAKTAVAKLKVDVAADVKNLFKKQADNVSSAVMQSAPAQAIKAEETKKALKEYAPFIAIAALVLVFIGMRWRK